MVTKASFLDGLPIWIVFRGYWWLKACSFQQYTTPSTNSEPTSNGLDLCLTT